MRGTPANSRREVGHDVCGSDDAPQLSPLNCFGRPEEVAQASLWVLSDQSSYVTGCVIHVDAGHVQARAPS